MRGDSFGKQYLKDGKQSWQIAKSHLKRYGLLQKPSSIHGLLGPICYTVDKANIIADCLQNQFTAHDLCDCNYRRHVEALLATIEEDISVIYYPVTSHKICSP
jgi:hypothetical protein